MSLIERRVTGRHRMGRLGAWVRQSAAFPLRLYLLLAVWYASWVVAWSQRRWRLRSFFVVASKSRLDCAASLRRAARVPPRR